MRLVLLVDDDPDIRYLMRVVLEAAGYSVAEAIHGQAALIRLEAEPVPEIVVTDLMMPVMKGNELVRRLRADLRWADLKIVVASSNVHSDEADEIGALGIALLDKMDVVDDLVRTIQALEAPVPGRADS